MKICITKVMTNSFNYNFFTAVPKGKHITNELEMVCLGKCQCVSALIRYPFIMISFSFFSNRVLLIGLFII